MRTRSSKAKLELRSMPSAVKKKLRSELPRRRRIWISPIVKTLGKNFVKHDKSSCFSVDSSSCSFFGDEVSCQSSFSVGSEKKPSRAITRKRKLGDSENLADLFLARSNYGGKDEPEVSESSCVESNDFGVGNGGLIAKKRLKLKSKRVNRTETVKKIDEEKEDSKGVTTSEISCVDRISGAQNSNVLLDIVELNEVVSCVSAAESNFEEKLEEKTIEDEEEYIAEESEFCEVSRNFLDKTLDTIPNSELRIDQKPEIGIGGIDSEYLACTEHFSYDSHETVNSELQSEIFLENSDLDFSDYTPSLFFDSGSDFSERSEGGSDASPTFSLLLHYRAEFSRSTSPQDVEVLSRVKEEYIDQSKYVKFEDEIDEDSYQMLRKREKRVVILRDYIEDYSSTTEYGSLILQQRSHMIHWMVQNCKERNLQQETTFLGVSLLDRFLSKGYFKSKRALQIVGIACLSLATRIEENQPYNSVRTRTFSVGSNIYSRCEVVAMEWLVQEVLNFQCFLPTIFNFLWFYLKAAKAEEDVEKRAKYLAVLLLPDQVQMYYMPSTVAAAVVILASLEGQDSPIHNVMETHIRTEDDDLHECIESLEWLLRYVC